MKGARLACEACIRAFVFKSIADLEKLARWVIDSDPEHSRLTACRKSAAIFNDDFKWFNSACGDRSCSRELLDVYDWNVTKEFQSEVQVVFATPPCARIGD